MAKYIKEIRIKGLKIFKKFSAKFNNDLNIIVGENESGKSTLLEALSIVLNQSIKNIDKSYIEALVNKTDLEEFEENPCIETLPSISIELFLNMDSHDKYADEFYGEIYDGGHRHPSYGISFGCNLDKDVAAELLEDIKEKRIPFEYYQMTWTTFKGFPYIIKHKPINFLFVDASNSFLSFDNYSKNIFLTKYKDGKELAPKHFFSSRVKDIFNDLELEKIDEERTFEINNRKLSLENVISIKDGKVLLENKGSGAASITKVELALNNNLKSEVVAIEEPGNHLSHTHMRKMLHNIKQNMEGKQLFITTHNNLIVSNFDLNKTCWVNAGSTSLVSFSNLDGEVAKYFIKLENHNLLQFILAHKVILVEGPTEAMLVPYLFKQEFNAEVAEEQIDIISCNGLSYGRYLEIAKSMGKKVAVITDNDGSDEKIVSINEFNNTNALQHVFTDSSKDRFTWEKCLFEDNETNTAFCSLISLPDGAEYKIKGQENERIEVRYLENHKVEISYKIIDNKITIAVPQYMKEALTWIKS